MQAAAYYFPNYHVDSRNELQHGTGWTEWELMKCATPRFEGHRQPRIPLWGYGDEADPAVMAVKIDNEWTEGSYLEPDTFNKYKLLEIIREEKGI